MILPFGIHRNPFRFKIIPNAPLVVPDVYFPLSDPRIDPAFWSFVRNDGGDIRVVSQDGLTPLPCQLVGFNAGAKVGSLFIKTGGSTAFYVCFGDRQLIAPPVNSAYGQYNTWESAASLIMHGENLNDSTAYQNNGGGPAPPTIAPAKFINGFNFNGNQNLIIPDSVSLRPSSAVTISCWVKPTSLVARQALFDHQSEPPYYGYGLQMLGGGDVNFDAAYNVNGIDNTSTVSLSTSAFNRVTAVYDGSHSRLYFNGVLDTQPVATGALTYTITQAAVVGSRCVSPYSYKLNGLLCELRVYSRALLASEEAQFFANQNSPATFWSFVGPPEPA